MKLASAPGRSATDPTGTAATRFSGGFGAILKRIFLRAGTAFLNDDIPTVAAGATFYILLAFFPAVGAFVSLYGLFADIPTAREHLSYLRDFLPGDALRFVGDEMVRITTTHPSQLSGAFALSLVFSVWSANAGVSSLIAGLNVAYEVRETRGFVATNLLSLIITIGALFASIGAFVLVVAIPILQTSLGLPSFDVLEFLRWPIIFVGTMAVVAALYRYGPNRRRRERRRVMFGALFASSAWLLVSLGFSWYLGNFGHYDRAYGSLATMMGFLMWMWLGLMVILFGAELNCEIERLG